MRDRLLAAHAQYYTPTTNGLKSFHCAAAIDWKALLTRFSKTEIEDDNPFLGYLKTVHISVTDDLNGKGSLEWSDTGTPPEGTEEPAAQVRDGLKRMMGGFFQSWNAYMNGSMVPLPDATVQVTAAGPGVHLHGTLSGTTIDEDFDKNMLLTKVNVSNDTLKVAATPGYVETPDGLVISSIASVINQPPTAPQVETTFHIEYTPVEAFQLPSHIAVDIKNTGVIEVNFSSCAVSRAAWAKKP